MPQKARNQKQCLESIAVMAGYVEIPTYVEISIFK